MLELPLMQAAKKKHICWGNRENLYAPLEVGASPDCPPATAGADHLIFRLRMIGANYFVKE